MKTLLPIALLAGLAGCAGQTATTVSSLEVALTAADQAALGYVTLHACPVTDGSLCSNAAVSAKIKLASATAYASVKAAEGNTGTAAAAQAAIAALVTLTPIMAATN